MPGVSNEGILRRDLKALVGPLSPKVAVMEIVNRFFESAASTMPPTPFAQWSSLQNKDMYTAQPSEIHEVPVGCEVDTRMNWIGGLHRNVRSLLEVFNLAGLVTHLSAEPCVVRDLQIQKEASGSCR